jgi:plasmid stability protein
MNQITIPNLDDRVVQRLKQMAWQEGLPLEESLRRLLVDAALAPHAEHKTAHAPGHAIPN